MALNLQKHALTFVILFALLGALASAIKLSALWGAPNQTFTLFDLMGVLPTAFLGLWTGLAAILIAKLFAFLTVPGATLDALSLLRLLPALAGGAFFWAYASKHNSAKSIGPISAFIQFVIPMLAISLFILHPAIWGTGAMIFALYWLIPVFSALLPSNLFLRSLGATFSQHAVGGVIWLYTVPAAANPAFWLALIPVVAIERLVFASGITLSYVSLHAVLSRIEWIASSGQVRLAPQSAPARKFIKK